MQKSKKKRIILLFLIFSAFIACISIPFIFDDTPSSKDTQKELPGYMFYEPDYEMDILSDPEYLRLNRIILYTNGAVSITVSPDDYKSTDEVLYFLSEFVNTMIEGDFTAYPSFFSENYKSEYELPQKFTMQRIYDISIEKIDEDTDQIIYKLDYLIDRNDGTLRRDIGSGESRPQYLVIEEINGAFYIDDVLTYTYQN